jgi:hypothetical protein
MTQVYSKDGSAAFNHELHEMLISIADEVELALERNLVSLVLGGGYGRGEGGVVLSDGKEMPYNDLDFTLIVTRKFRLPWERLRDIGSAFGRRLKIHVDFSRPLTIQDVEHWPSWLMWYDLLNGHVILKGPQDFLTRHAPPSLKKPLPVIEGTRLLLNRGAGLLWALRIIRGIENSPDEDFVRRNFYKCALALGDALLIAYKRYNTKYAGRDELLMDLERDERTVDALQLRALYTEALRFKFRPDHVSPGPKTEEDLNALAGIWGSVFLHVETIRSGVDWQSLEDYVRWNGIRESDQHTPSLIFRNLARGLQIGRWSWRYPRESLYRLLPVLLGLAKDQVNDWPKQTDDFLRIWNRFN